MVVKLTFFIFILQWADIQTVYERVKRLKYPFLLKRRKKHRKTLDWFPVLYLFGSDRYTTRVVYVHVCCTAENSIGKETLIWLLSFTVVSHKCLCLYLVINLLFLIESSFLTSGLLLPYSSLINFTVTYWGYNPFYFIKTFVLHYSKRFGFNRSFLLAFICVYFSFYIQVSKLWPNLLSSILKTVQWKSRTLRLFFLFFVVVEE